jgi:hypothetical protein
VLKLNSLAYILVVLTLIKNDFATASIKLNFLISAFLYIQPKVKFKITIKKTKLKLNCRIRRTSNTIIEDLMLFQLRQLRVPELMFPEQLQEQEHPNPENQVRF